MTRVCLVLGNLVLLLAFSDFGATRARADFCVNKDLVNLGPTAYDIAVVLKGAQRVTRHFDGYTFGGLIHFGGFGTRSVGGNTQLHWQFPTRPINPGDFVHVGWCTPTYSPVLDMYWTDQAGRRIPGSVVYEIVPHGCYDGEFFTVSFHNPFLPHHQQPGPVILSNVRYAILSDPWPLDQLNQFNDALMAQLQPLADELQIDPRQAIRLILPEPVPPDGYVLLVYDADAVDSMANTRDFVQMDVAEFTPSTPPAPK